jgi:hypothetical protein
MIYFRVIFKNNLNIYYLEGYGGSEIWSKTLDLKFLNPFPVSTEDYASSLLSLYEVMNY